MIWLVSKVDYQYIQLLAYSLHIMSFKNFPYRLSAIDFDLGQDLAKVFDYYYKSYRLRFVDHYDDTNWI